ncbi:hypothetical protein B0H14DRAFT_3105362 [Mycena olivaceomarginata]|nr:hypothetical protein B0H14DRAFT_3105362 [Mycena olivaceomarginata]
MSSARSHPKVLVVGAGPSGLVMALALLRNGVPVRLIDKEVGHCSCPILCTDRYKPISRLGQRGAGIMPRSLELFSALGVGDEILRRAIPAPQAVLYEMPEGVKMLSKFDMWPPVLPTPQRPFPNVVMLGQDHLEQILRTELQKLGCETEWGTTLLSFEQPKGGDCVHTSISRPGSEEDITESVTFDFLVGTDGARGIVRKSLGLTFLGETSNADRLVVGDVMVFGLDPKLWHMWGEVGAAWISLRPTEVPFMWSFLLQGPNIDHPYIVEHPEALAPIFVEYTGRRRDIVFGDVVWLSHYRPSVRMVDRFGVGRVFVAGDSFNLAWKVALVQRNLAPESLLQTYTEERAPVVAAMLNQITLLLKENWAGKTGAPPPSPGGVSAWKHNGGVLQLGVNYRWSSIVVDEQQPDTDPLDDEFDDFDFGEGEDEEDDSFNTFVDRPLSAGDRAPDSPWARHEAPANAPTSLFRTFLASHHTVLIFSDASRSAAVIRLLASLVPHAVQSVVVVRAQGTITEQHELADWVLEDRAGYAYSTYALRDGCDIVVVRPDGLVGAIVRSRSGLQRYFRGVFKPIDIVVAYICIAVHN